MRHGSANKLVVDRIMVGCQRQDNALIVLDSRIDDLTSMAGKCINGVGWSLIASVVIRDVVTRTNWLNWCN